MEELLLRVAATTGDQRALQHALLLALPISVCCWAALVGIAYCVYAVLA